MARNNKQITGTLAKEYCKKFPTAATQEIARALITDHPECFRDLEHARSIVRYYRGALGDTKREKAKEIIPRVIIPKADKPIDWTPFVIDTSPACFIGDIHLPYHDERVLDLFFNNCAKIGAKTIGFMGDSLDCYQLSKWQKNPKFRDFPSEIRMFKDLLESVHKAFPDALIVVKEGNHEERYERYLCDHAPALFGLEQITLHSLLEADRQWLEYVSDKRVITTKKLNIIHGHEYPFAISNPVNPARGLYTRAKKNSMCFHFHQTSEHSETAINGDLTTCWSVGCGCQLHPAFAPLNKWNHGFADVFSEGDNFTVHNYRILNGKVL
jgi:hypothetical protein